MTWSLRETVPAFLGSPFAILHHVAGQIKWQSREAKQAYGINHGQIFDYGARPSIREDASNQHGSRHYFLDRDEAMYVLLLQKSLIREISDFLSQHNIELDEFQAQVQIIIDASFKNYNLHVGGDISNSNVSVGENVKSGGDTKTG